MNWSNRLVAAGALAAALLLAACRPAPSGELQPPEILYGQEMCDECGMLIDQPEFAAATLTYDGATYKFDAISDMVAYHAKHPQAQVQAWFVHDFGTEAWTRAETAFFVHSQSLVAPMGHGVAAFIDETDAQELAGTVGASVISFDVLRAELAVAEHETH
ncbi:MAG: nitrous oxide reductase accessory protein NosL [Anaerolineales bacterium]|nr:nitrous oxide reductase accessory protein NosL [Anaerolineales bacterium]